MNSAFQDMDALMLKAKDMVKLAAELNEKLTAATTTSKLNNSHLSSTWSPYNSHSAGEPEEATFIRSSLSQLGLQMSNAPVTMDMMKAEQKYLTETGPKTTMQISAAEEDLPVGLVAEMVDAVEDDGRICRDDSGAAIVGGGSGTGSEIRWWANVFVEYRWDGQE